MTDYYSLQPYGNPAQYPTQYPTQYPGSFNNGLSWNGPTYSNLGSTFVNSPAVQTFGNIAPGSTYAVTQNINYTTPSPQYSTPYTSGDASSYLPAYAPPSFAPGEYYPPQPPYPGPHQGKTDAALLQLLQLALLNFMENGAYRGPGFQGDPCHKKSPCHKKPDCGPRVIIKEEIIEEEVPSPTPTPEPELPRERMDFTGGRTLNYTHKDIYVRDDGGDDFYDIQGNDNIIQIDGDKDANSFRVGGTNNQVTIRDIGRDDGVTLSGDPADWREAGRGSDGEGHFMTFVNSETGTIATIYTDHQEWTHDELLSHIVVGDPINVPYQEQQPVVVVQQPVPYQGSESSESP